ncbi:MAG TPA: protein phosphatase 2C domain-containing protein [Acidimicrobiia bacterium]|nr:protein phosphatase 2C domain-containing protein [Acidimicrobiia bacterium]
MTDEEAPPPEGNGVIRASGTFAKFAFGLVSEAGPLRDHNEDCAGAFVSTAPDDAWDRGPIFVVADGMGGHAAGEVASRLAVDTVIDRWTSRDPLTPPQGLRTAARAANEQIMQVALEPGKRGMGTTLLACALAGHDAHIAHVGDSRAYLVRDGECRQLTNDHSRVGEMMRMRLITPEQAATHPARSQLTQSIGADPLVRVDLIREPCRAGDVFVLCCDGIWDVLTRPEIADFAGELGHTLRHAGELAEYLVDTAIKRQSADNVTALVVQVTSDQPVPPAVRRSLFSRRRS